MRVALVTHGGKGDAFWDLVRRGAETAAAKDWRANV
jgi:simple sugar transport system substrate-binding protein